MADSTPYIREDVQGFLALVNSLPPPEALVAEEQRAGYLAMKAMTEADPRPMAVIKDLTCPGPAGAIPVRFYDVRESRDPSPVILFFHGGGFVIGDLDTHNSLCTELSAELDLPVLAVHYRLAPEHPFPAAPDDCEAAARWIAQAAPTLGVPATGLVLMGDSAGGNLAIVTAQALAARPAALPVLLHVPVYPVAGPVGRHASYRAYREGHLLTREALARFHAAYAAPLDDPRHYPLLHPDHGRSPPALVVTAECDPLRDSGREYAARLAEAGATCEALEFSGAIHGFMTLRKAIPSAQSDLETLTRAMTRLLERPA